MTAFATADDFAFRIGLTLDVEEQARATALLEQASGEIREESDQVIDLVTDDVLVLPGTTDERILLPQRPVVSVSSVELDGVAISDWYLTRNTIVRRGTTFVANALDDSYSFFGPYRGFGRESQTLRIVYTHGFAAGAIPERLKNITLEMVARVWVNPSSLIQENVAGVATTFAPYSSPPRGLQLTDSERRALRRLFGSRSGAGSVWMGG
jgi:hypothetical protein